MCLLRSACAVLLEFCLQVCALARADNLLTRSHQIDMMMMMSIIVIIKMAHEKKNKQIKCIGIYWTGARKKMCHFVFFLFFYFFFLLSATYRFVRAHFNYYQPFELYPDFFFSWRWLKFIFNEESKTCDFFFHQFCEGLATTWNVWNIVCVHFICAAQIISVCFSSTSHHSIKMLPHLLLLPLLYSPLHPPKNEEFF